MSAQRKRHSGRSKRPKALSPSPLSSHADCMDRQDTSLNRVCAGMDRAKAGDMISAAAFDACICAYYLQLCPGRGKMGVVSTLLMSNPAKVPGTECCHPVPVC